jgi:uncharacterized protein (DUF488 family)
MGKNVLVIHTIGHSDRSVRRFIDLLQQHGIQLVADARSQPYSRWTPQFNREVLLRSLQEVGIDYKFMGDQIGGRPTDPSLYEVGRDHPDYERLEQTPSYQTGIGRLLKLAQSQRTAVMCSEADHRDCHRHLLIAQTLRTHGVRVLHIQKDGRAVEAELLPRQLTLL